MHIRFLLPLPVFILLLASCTNSSILINPLYNRLDEQILTSFEKLAEFDNEQTAEFNRLVENFHYWHRTLELPDYADLLNNIQASIRSKGSTRREDIEAWLQQSQLFSHAFRSCHPINFSSAIIRTISDSQLETIKENRSKQQSEFRKKYFDETPQERQKRREANFIKWAGRIGLELNDKQTLMLRETLAKQKSLRKQFYALSDDWNKQLYTILEDRGSPELEQRMARHLEKRWTMMRETHPEQWQHNRDVWIDFIDRLIQSLTNEQRSYISGWIKKMGKTLLNVSRKDIDKPIFGDAIGCAQGATNATDLG